MAVSTDVFAVFGHFQNLNLLGLVEDLRAGRTIRQAWLSGTFRCPVAHGMPHGAHVHQLRAFGQTAEFGEDCNFAARQIGADWDAVLCFVQAWDEGMIDTRSLLRQLEEVWRERLMDAEAVQLVLHAPDHARRSQWPSSTPS